MSTSKFVNNLKFGIVDVEVGMMVVVIFSIKEPTKDAGCCKARMSAGSIPPVPREMEKMDREVCWKAENRDTEGWNLHQGVFDKAIFPRPGSDNLLGIHVVPSVKPVQAGHVKKIVDDKCPDFSYKETRS